MLKNCINFSKKPIEIGSYYYADFCRNSVFFKFNVPVKIISLSNDQIIVYDLKEEKEFDGIIYLKKYISKELNELQKLVLINENNL